MALSGIKILRPKHGAYGIYCHLYAYLIFRVASVNELVIYFILSFLILTVPFDGIRLSSRILRNGHTQANLIECGENASLDADAAHGHSV